MIETKQVKILNGKYHEKENGFVIYLKVESLEFSRKHLISFNSKIEQILFGCFQSSIQFTLYPTEYEDYVIYLHRNICSDERILKFLLDLEKEFDFKFK